MRHASTSPLKQPEVEYKIKVVKGPNKGDEFKILSPIITIGRSSDNDISLAKDLKCSRKHARLSLNSQGAFVENLNSHNPIFVNGQSKKIINLVNTSRFTLGQTTLEFQVQVYLSPTNLDVQKQMIQPLESTSPQKSYNPYNSHQEPANPAKKRFQRFFIYALVIAPFFWFFAGSGDKKEELFKIRTKESVKQDIETSFELAEQEKQEQIQKGFKNSTVYRSSISLRARL